MQQSVIKRSIRVLVIGVATSVIFACAQHVPSDHIHDIEYTDQSSHANAVLLFQPVKRPPIVRLTFLEHTPIEGGADYEGISCLAELDAADQSYSCFVVKQVVAGNGGGANDDAERSRTEGVDGDLFVEKIVAGRLDSDFCKTLRGDDVGRAGDIPVMQDKTCRTNFDGVSNCVCYTITHHDCEVDDKGDCQVGAIRENALAPPDPGSGSGGHGGTGN